ncbi:hypothetical protein CLIM01_02240 [Colletotrichum limetticola]|uniref:Uncharacterized protein n=1 Tax=Colletotrichum limetticola TaxID=1209924 RepID=A0ABQ9Q9R6_9PEZI|nr:hypothetical protein CLIM01_02240 [Colletotrichum limetticola]
MSQATLPPRLDSISHAMHISLQSSHQLAYVKPRKLQVRGQVRTRSSRVDKHVSRRFSWLTSAGHLRKAAGKGDRPRQCSLDGGRKLGVSIELYTLTTSFPTF